MTNRRCVPFLRWLVPNGSAFPRLPRRFAPRNDKSDSLLHPEGRKGKPESAFLPCHCEEGASPTRQSQAGTIEFAGAFLCSGVYCEIAAAPAEPRNDKLGGLFPFGGAHWQACNRLPPVSLRGGRKPDAAISSRHLRIRRGFPVFRRVLRDCHVASLLAMTNRGCMPV